MIKILGRLYQAIGVPIITDTILKYRRIIVTTIHVVQSVLANYLAFLLRFDSTISPVDLSLFLTYLPLLSLIRLLSYSQANLHKDLWRFSSISTLNKIIKSSTIGSIVFFIGVRYFLGEKAYPLSIYVLDWLLLIALSAGSRLFVRLLRENMHRHSLGKRAVIIGASDAGIAVMKDLKNNPKYGLAAIGFIDENPYKKGLRLEGIPIFGSRSMLPKVIEEHRPDEILITMDFETNNTVLEIYKLCKPYDIAIKKLPRMNEIIESVTGTRIGQRLIKSNLIEDCQLKEALSLQEEEGGRLGAKLIKLGYISEEKLIAFLTQHYGVSHMEPISLEDLLQREPVRTDIQSVNNFIKGKSVLVSGAGGSIGSELCRQILKYNPSELILLDRHENSLFHIDLELRNVRGGARKEPTLIVPVVRDICDGVRMKSLFSKYKPQVVFHAAAYKHVPMMEMNPIEAIKNNILGTKTFIDAAVRSEVECFVTISTDKAVRPTSIMGATKRVAELLTMHMNNHSTTKFKTVRFGNVLGSNGSVIHVFKEQLKNGGPLTVTHPDIKRFFMLIPEAVQLVLIAAASKKNGGVFVLDMGEQIKIVDLAENFIKCAGLIPHKDIRLTFTGLRPGEKLYEELFDDAENVEKSIPSEKFTIAAIEVPSKDEIGEYLLAFESIVKNNLAEEVIPAIRRIIPKFKQEVSPSQQEQNHASFVS